MALTFFANVSGNVHDGCRANHKVPEGRDAVKIESNTKCIVSREIHAETFFCIAAVSDY
jgi:hypothetical protein